MPTKPNKKRVKALLDSLGIELKPEDFAPGKAPKEEFKNALPGRKYSKDQEIIHAESVLVALAKVPKDWYYRTCKHCGEGFYSNYYYVGFCGDQCRALSLKKMGIQWTNHFDESAKWGNMTPPMIIPPEALKAMKYLVERAEQGNLQSAGMIEPVQELHPLYDEQSLQHIAHHSPNESEQVLPDKTDEIPDTATETETEDDFLDILASLDV